MSSLPRLVLVLVCLCVCVCVFVVVVVNLYLSTSCLIYMSFCIVLLSLSVCMYVCVYVCMYGLVNTELMLLTSVIQFYILNYLVSLSSA